MRSPIIIVEGPAGSGKSTFVRHMEQDLGAVGISRSLPARSPGKIDAALSSWRNDILKLQDALVVRHKPAVVDRMVFSQWVYGNLRAGNKEAKGSPMKVWTDFERLILEVIQDLNSRLEYCGCDRLDIPRFALVLLLPGEETIRKYRGSANREFPWSIQQELEAYSRIKEFGRMGSMLEKVLPWNIDIHGPLRTKIEAWMTEEI